MNPRRLTPLIFALLLSITASCGKSVEGETKRWEANVAKVQTLAAKYPSLKSALDARLAAAKTTFDAAAKLDEKAKADAMAPANNALMAGFVGDLAEIEAALGHLRESRISAASMAGDESSRLAAKLASDDAQKAIERSEAALQKGASDEAGASALVEKIKSDIASAQKAVDIVLEQDRKKVAAKEAEKAAAKTSSGETTKTDANSDVKTAPPPPPPEWQCEYCKGMNKHDVTNCASCGAPKPAPKPEPAAKK
jgi:hypothetical protein